MKLQKQWPRWMEKAGLKRDAGRGFYGQHYMIGRDRRWRVNCYGQFECSCPLEYFDRWANSSGGQMDGIPKTEVEFIVAVNLLIAESEDKR